MHRRPFSWAKLIPLAVNLFAFALRLYRLDSQSFAFDEGWTSYAIHHSWREIWSALAPDNHPPLYYVLVKAFAEATGYTDFPLRFFSVVCGTALVASLYALGKRLGSEPTGLSAALFAACSPSLVYYSQEARMYSLLMALTVLSTVSLVRISDDPQRRRWWLAYVVTTSGALYTHYFAVLLLLTQNLAWIVWSMLNLVRDARPNVRAFVSYWAKRWMLGQGAILLLYLPWLPTAIRQTLIGQGTWWRMPLPTPVILKDVWRFSVLGPRRPMGVPVLGSLIGAVGLAVVVAALLGWRRRGGAWAFALLTWTLPVALIVLIGSRLSIYTNRYALVALPGLALLVGIGISACWEALSGRLAWLGRLAAWVLLATALISPLPQLNAYYHDPTYWREDFRRAAEYLVDKSAPGDTVILLGCSQPIMHYYRGSAAVLRFPQRGDSVQSEKEVISLLRQHVNPDHRVRLVMYSWPTVDPQGLVEGQLRSRCELRGEHWQTETGQRPIRVINFAACDTDFGVEPRHPLGAIWDRQVVLSSYRFSNFAPGKQAHIVLWWRTLGRADQDYSVFVHLLDAQGEMISQFDKLPLSDFYPMRVWPSNVDQRDAYPLQVPKDADLEGAWLAIGLYDRRTGQRLPVSQDDVPVGDLIRIPLTP